MHVVGGANTQQASPPSPNEDANAQTWKNSNKYTDVLDLVSRVEQRKNGPSPARPLSRVPVPPPFSLQLQPPYRPMLPASLASSTDQPPKPPLLLSHRPPPASTRTAPPFQVTVPRVRSKRILRGERVLKPRPRVKPGPGDHVV